MGCRDLGLPINQYDQAMTNIAFSGVVLIGIRALGIFLAHKRLIVFYIFGNMRAG
jgi:hypothetical protein